MNKYNYIFCYSMKGWSKMIALIDQNSKLMIFYDLKFLLIIVKMCLLNHLAFYFIIFSFLKYTQNLLYNNYLLITIVFLYFKLIKRSVSLITLKIWHIDVDIYLLCNTQSGWIANISRQIDASSSSLSLSTLEWHRKFYRVLYNAHFNMHLLIFIKWLHK